MHAIVKRGWIRIVEFLFLDASGKKVKVNVVRTFYGSDHTFEPINLINVLKKEIQPIPYSRVAGLAFKMYLTTHSGSEEKNQSLTSLNHDLAAYYQLLNKIGLPGNEIKENPEERIKTFLKSLNIECKRITSTVSGYDVTLYLSSAPLLEEDMATIEKLFSTLLKYGITVDKARQSHLPQTYKVSINKGSPGFGKDKITIDPKDKFPGNEKNESKQSRVTESAFQSLSLDSPSEEEPAKKNKHLAKVF